MGVETYKNQFKKYVNFINKYRASLNAASGSEVDANANVENKNVTTCSGEIYKREAIGTNRLLMIEKITDLFGADLAEEYIRQLDSHEIYRHDETNPMLPYCVSITMYPFLFDGLTGIGGISKAPKNLDSFCGGFINLVFAVASQFAGAVATPEFLMYLDYFIRKEYGDDYYLHIDKIIYNKSIEQIIESKFQQVVYSLNQPAAARNFQSVFWNIAYFDKPYFTGMFENFVFPDGTAPKWDSVNWIQKKFMKWFNSERLKNILTFPVETVNLLNDGVNAVDEEWEDFAAEMWAEGHSFFMYTSDSVDSLASCCFDGSQMTLTKLNDKVNYMSFKDVYNLYNESVQNKDNHFTIFHDGKWVDGRVIRVHKRPLYKITTSNDKEIIVTDNHLSPTQDGDKKTTDLTTDDYLKFSTNLNNPEYNTEYMWTNNAIYYKIKSIEPYKNNNDYCYCFEMNNVDEPYFTLPNGIITHNCRLKNEVTENTFSYTLGAGGVSTGSKGVITININRLVQNTISNNNISFEEKCALISSAVKEQVQKLHKYMIAYNEIVKDNFKARMLPVYDAGFISLEKQYLTIGINGFVEGAEYLGIKPNVNEEYLKYGEAILKPIYEENKKDKTKEIMFNTEFVPKMCGC